MGDSARFAELQRKSARDVKAVGMVGASTSLEMVEYIRELEDVLIETDEYLADNPKSYVGSGSILHTKMRDILGIK